MAKGADGLHGMKRVCPDPGGIRSEWLTEVTALILLNRLAGSAPPSLLPFVLSLNKRQTDVLFLVPISPLEGSPVLSHLAGVE